MTDEATLTALSMEIREPVRTFADLVREAAGGLAQGLAVFGAAATGAFNPATQTIRSVVVLETIDLAALRRLAAHGTRLGKLRIAAPLMMTPKYIASSRDVFPLELFEIQQCHVQVFGGDHFAELNFDNAHVRLQCERELKATLIGMRQGLLATAGREKLLGALEEDVIERLLRTLRGMLLLKGERKALPSDAVVMTVEQILDRRLAGVRTALDPRGPRTWDQFDTLYTDVAALGEAVDAW